uniref:Uncharacterized protein n=1 Tax=Timema poppense TaxID=170557 RepID=A0A7R9HE89_TIMPO|nr:unnamed protein product [Timema poppensis]
MAKKTGVIKGGGVFNALIFIVVVTNVESFLQCRDTVTGYIVSWDATPYIVLNLIRMEESRKDDEHKNIEKENYGGRQEEREITTRKIHTRKSFPGLPPGSLACRRSLRRRRALLFFKRTRYENMWSSHYGNSFIELHMWEKRISSTS